MASWHFSWIHGLFFCDAVKSYKSNPATFWASRQDAIWAYLIHVYEAKEYPFDRSNVDMRTVSGHWPRVKVGMWLFGWLLLVVVFQKHTKQHKSCSMNSIIRKDENSTVCWRQVVSRTNTNYTWGCWQIGRTGSGDELRLLGLVSWQP